MWLINIQEWVQICLASFLKCFQHKPGSFGQAGCKQAEECGSRTTQIILGQYCIYCYSISERFFGFVVLTDPYFEDVQVSLGFHRPCLLFSVVYFSNNHGKCWVRVRHDSQINDIFWFYPKQQRKHRLSNRQLLDCTGCFLKSQGLTVSLFLQLYFNIRFMSGLACYLVRNKVPSKKELKLFLNTVWAGNWFGFHTSFWVALWGCLQKMATGQDKETDACLFVDRIHDSHALLQKFTTIKSPGALKCTNMMCVFWKSWL